MLPVQRYAAPCPPDGLLFDLDDTVLDHGSLAAATYAELWRLSERGVPLVAVTGRPASWGEVLARQWPIEGAVTENGAIAVVRQDRGIARLDRCSPTERQARRGRLRALTDELMSRFPELQLTDDCGGRVSDVTVDIGERVSLPPERVERAATLARELGARTTRSSVHLHLSLDPDDKASGALRFLHQRLGVRPSAARFRWAFIGDSENDAACFAAFAQSVGVANLRGRFSLPPRYITRAERGQGFIEATRLLFPEA